MPNNQFEVSKVGHGFKVNMQLATITEDSSGNVLWMSNKVN